MRTMKLFYLLCALLLNDTSYGKDCFDSDWHCSSLKMWCKRTDHIGFNIRKKCPLTCGVCKPPTLAPGTTFPPHVGGCGQPDVHGVTRVIGGKTAVPHSWPWQVLMIFQEGRQLCGGTLIAPQWVITAAHCVYRRERDLKGYKIRVGDHDRLHFEGPEVEIGVKKIIRHEGYDIRNRRNDIAMIKLARPVKFNKYVSPACLPKAAVHVGMKCYVTGWGKLIDHGWMSRTLTQGVFPVVSNKQCYLKNHHQYSFNITDDMICGGSGGTSPTATCFGDSGGPFVCEVNGVWELHGTVSFGSPVCNSSTAYTVSSRTFHFLDWIKKNMENKPTTLPPVAIFPPRIDDDESGIPGQNEASDMLHENLHPKTTMKSYMRWIYDSIKRIVF